MNWFIIGVFWVMLSAAVGVLANRYNRSAAGWVTFSIFLSPLMGFIFVLAAGPLPESARSPQSPHDSAISRRREPRTVFETVVLPIGAVTLILGAVVFVISQGGQSPQPGPVEAKLYWDEMYKGYSAQHKPEEHVKPACRSHKYGDRAYLLYDKALCDQHRGAGIAVTYY